jgi:hypothetical protein
MRVVVDTKSRRRFEEATAVYVWPRAVRCCGGRNHVLEASFEPSDRAFELVHASDGFQVWTSEGMALPAEIHLDVDKRNRPRAFWNGQAWVG